MVTLKIDGKAVSVPENAPLIEAADRAGVRIPTLCHHAELEPYGVCRVCTVEVRQRGKSRFVTACNYPAREGIEVFTDTQKVRDTRRILIELLLAQAPRARDVQALAKEYGVAGTRFPVNDPTNDCHLCGLCVRTCNEIVGRSAIGFSGRGSARTIKTPTREPELCIACGACAYVCPTGHMTMEALATDYIRRHEASPRQCRWSRLGVVSHLDCFNDFECYHCEIDQRMEERFGTHPAFVVKPAQKKLPQRAGQFLWAPDRAYHPGHVWAKAVGDLVLVGFDDFARQLVGPLDEVHTTSTGDALNAGGVAWELVSGPRRARMVAPVRGTVVEVNPAMLDEPDVVCADPYGRGWMLALAPSARQEDMGKLMRELDVRAWLEADTQRLLRRLGTDFGVPGVGLGATAADGGTIELPAKLGEKDWSSLARTFFLA